MAAIQGLVGIVALVFGLIGIGLNGEAYNRREYGRYLAVDESFYSGSGNSVPDYFPGGVRIPDYLPGGVRIPDYFPGGVRIPDSFPGVPGVAAIGTGRCKIGDQQNEIGRFCFHEEENYESYYTYWYANKGLEKVDPLLFPALYGSAALAFAGLIGMAAAAGKAAPEVMGAAFGTALVFNLVAFGLACQISSYISYGPSLQQLKDYPTVPLWKAYFSDRCYNTDWRLAPRGVGNLNASNERCAPGSFTEAILAFAILNCLINSVAVVFSVCGQDMAPRVKG